MVLSEYSISINHVSIPDFQYVHEMSKSFYILRDVKQPTTQVVRCPEYTLPGVDTQGEYTQVEHDVHELERVLVLHPFSLRLTGGAGQDCPDARRPLDRQASALRCVANMQIKLEQTLPETKQSGTVH